MRLMDVNQDESLSILVMGDSGAGKTCFTASFPGPIFIHDFDGKAISAANLLRRKKDLEKLAQIDTINYSQIGGKEDLARGITFGEDTARLRMATFNGWLVEHEALVRGGNEFPWKTVVFDSLTTWSDILIADILRATKGKIKPPVDGMNHMPGMQTYSINMIEFKALLGRFLALPCNKVVIAHIERDKDEHTGRILNQAKVSGKLASYLPIVFGEVYRAFVEQTPSGPKYKLQTATNSDFNCRSQLGLPQFVDADYKSLLGMSPLK